MISIYAISVLFSSSSKYPELNCLDAFISYHGGTIHAYTELEFVSHFNSYHQFNVVLFYTDSDHH